MSKQIPRVLIVGGVSSSFKGAYEVLKLLELKGEVEIVHQEYYKKCDNLGDEEYSDDKHLTALCPTGFEDFNYTLEDFPVVEKKHQKP